MLKMLLEATSLFIQGRLFRDPWLVMRLWAGGLLLAVAVMVGMVKLGAPLWLAVVVSAFGGGALQPWLFRDVKFN